MGLLKGSVAISRFKVQGAMPANFWEWLNSRIKSNVFIEIEGTALEKAHGWASAHDYFDTSFAFENYNLNPYVLLGIRQDKRSVGASLLRKYHRLEMLKARAANPEAKLSKPDREILKEKARLGLLTRIPPQTSVWEMCWNTKDNEVWFSTSNKASLELSQEFFNKSFAPLTLVPLIPYILANEVLPLEKKTGLEFLTPLG